MKTSTKILIGTGVVGLGVGVYLLARPAKASIKPSETEGAVDGGVFRLSAEDTKAVACDLRAAKSTADVALVLGKLLEVVEDSGATEVDLRATGLTPSKMPVEDFRAEIEKQSGLLSATPGFLWGNVKEQIDTMLSGLPSCDAPLEQWAVFSGESSVQAVVAPPPFTLTQILSSPRE